MFKKPLSNLKTSAPLRSSDRRKLKHRIVQAFPLSSDDGDLLVPDGLLSIKFSTHLDEPGVAYLSPDGEPLWFTLGKGSDDLIPTVYTLWKRPKLLPCLSTPPEVIPILVGGADLMIPGVVQYPTSPALHVNQLVGITQYEHEKSGAVLAVGWMVVDGDAIKGKEEGNARKGKVVKVAHTWKDHLWELGSKGEPPGAVSVLSKADGGEREVQCGEEGSGEVSPPISVVDEASELKLTSQETTSLLRTSLIQAIHTTLPAASFPISATIFYTSHILPGRPARPWEALPARSSADPQTTTTSPVDIKHSTHKSLTAFLKSLEKEHLLKLKDINGQLYITAVSPTSTQQTENAPGGHSAGLSSLTPHTDVMTHRPYLSIADVERKAKRAKERELEGAGDSRGKEMVVKEMWKPHLQSVAFFEEAGCSLSNLYTLPEIKSAVNAYVVNKGLVNPNDQHYVNVDELLQGTLKSKANADEALEYLKRDELVKRIVEKMQAWNEIQCEGKDVVLKKGQLKPISIVVKIRQGRKASTLITNFEPFFLTAEFLAEELRKICASATSISPAQGKSSGLEVLVQGKQIKAVTELLMSRNVPKKWIDAVDVSDKKK